MGYLNQLDTSFLRMESERTPMHVAGLMVFTLPENAEPHYLQDLYDAISKSPVNLYPFNCKLKEGTFGVGSSWDVDENIDIDYHVRHSALPYPGGEKELGILVARLHSHPMDLSRPPWEFHLIEGLENNRYALYFKTHHSAIDGMGAMGMITRWLSDDPLASNGYGPWSMENNYKENAKKKGGAEKNILSRSLDVIREQANATVELSNAVYHMSKPSENPEGGMSSAINTPKTRFNTRITQQRRVATQLYDVSRFKALSKATGATINDVCLAVLGAATRRYLLELDALPEKPLVASIPIALPRPDGKPGNAVAGFVCPLETDKSDPKHRIQTINAVTSRTKKQLNGMSLKALNQFSFMGVAPLMLSQMAGIGKVIPPLFNLVVSNVVAPQKKLYLKGSELEALYPISLLFDGYALNVTIVGYSDKVAMGFVGCRAATPSLQRLAVYTGDALEELEKAVFE